MSTLAWRYPIVIQGDRRPARRRLDVMRESDDDAFTAAFAAHERWAFDEAYRRYAGLLYSAAFNVLGNGEDAADCVQDALTRVWRSRNAYNATRGVVRSFLLVCVRNAAISRRRAQARRQDLTQRLAAEPREHEELRAGDPVERDRLRAALTKLAPEQRMPLELAYYEGKTHVEIAAELCEPLGTVKSRIASGLRKLAKALEPTSA